jgi:hypothetical protein
VKPALVCIFLLGCGTTDGRLRFLSSQATQASWSFVIEDRARGAEILIDGRWRGDGCNRAGVQVRCELRGLFPGGHTVEVRLPAAVLKRSVVVGRPWSARPAFVRVRDPDEAAAAAQKGADGVVVDPSALEPADVIDAAHKHGARALVKDPSLIELAAADGVIGELPAPLRRRFPEARGFSMDEAASQAVQLFVDGGSGAAALESALSAATGLVRGVGLLGGAAALAGPSGALVDQKALPILDGRKRHASLREGKPQDVKSEGARYAVTFVKGGDASTLLLNGGKEPWRVEAALPTSPVDLLGGTLDGNAVTVAPHDVALLVHVAEKDKTRY